MSLPQLEPQGQSAILMDGQTLDRMRKYIALKHPARTSSERAAILADAVGRVVDGSLPQLGSKAKARLRRELLGRMGAEGIVALSASQIRQACSGLELNAEEQERLGEWIIESFPAEEGLEQHMQVLSRQSSPPGVFSGTGMSSAESEAASIVQPLPVRMLPRYRIAALSVLVLAAAVGWWMYSGWWGISGQAGLTPAAHETAGLEAGIDVAALLHQQADSGALPAPYAYRELPDPDKLREWLRQKGSLLAEEPYLSGIIAAAREHGIHPLLLFAITGQEQGYVPKNGKHAEKIANNPFNVYHSWKKYNTTIEDSAGIAARTVLSISRDRPEEAHPIEWLNTRYAEDPKWWVGVSSIFEKMRREIMPEGEQGAKNERTSQ